MTSRGGESLAVLLVSALLGTSCANSLALRGDHARPPGDIRAGEWTGTVAAGGILPIPLPIQSTITTSPVTIPYGVVGTASRGVSEHVEWGFGGMVVPYVLSLSNTQENTGTSAASAFGGARVSTSAPNDEATHFAAAADLGLGLGVIPCLIVRCAGTNAGYVPEASTWQGGSVGVIFGDKTLYVSARLEESLTGEHGVELHPSALLGFDFPLSGPFHLGLGGASRAPCRATDRCSCSPCTTSRCGFSRPPTEPPDARATP